MMRELNEKMIDESFSDFDTTFSTTIDYLNKINDYKQQNGFTSNSIRGLNDTLTDFNKTLKIYLSQIKRNVRV